MSEKDIKRIEVAVGVLHRQGNVLVAQRLVQDRYFEKWEFPGGKLEQGEEPVDALRRELKEELNINIAQVAPLIRLDHDYPDRQVRLHVYEVLEFSGEPVGYEGQAIQWVKPFECAQLDFLQANAAIVNAVVLPKLTLITNIAHYGLEQTLQCVRAIQAQFGCVMLVLRECAAAEELLCAYKDALQAVLLDGSLLLLNDEPELASKLGFEGVHLSAERARRFADRDQLALKWVGVSCHSGAELQHADAIADFAFLSPVEQTSSHPEQLARGWSFFAEHAVKSAIPVYALGGMAFDQLEQARSAQAQGVAMISAAWAFLQSLS